MHLIHNTPYDKVALKIDEMPSEDKEKVIEYKQAQQEASALASSIKEDDTLLGLVRVPSVSPLKRRIMGGAENQTSSKVSESGSAYQIPLKQRQ